jgi:hypothetical protein
MQEVSTRAVIAVSVCLAVVAALLIGMEGPSSASTHRPTHPSANPIPAFPPTRTPTPANLSPVSSRIGKVDWTPAVTSVGDLLSDGSKLVAALTEEVPSPTAFRAACRKLAHQPAPTPPPGSGGEQLSSLQAVTTDALVLVFDCAATINDAKSDPSNAAADGKKIGQDLATLRWDAANFYIDIGYSSGDQTKDATGLSAWTLAREIGFQQSDFPAGTIGDPSSPGGPDETTPVPASTPCSPVHSQPFVADYDSQSYDPSGVGNDSVYSEVLIMPAADANAALRAIGDPGYDTACFQPALDATTQSFQASSSCGSFTLLNSTISELPSTGFPPGSIGYRYEADTRCTGNGENGGIWYSDTISAVVGSAFIQGNFASFQQVPISTQIEQTAMNAMAARAARFRSGSA